MFGRSSTVGHDHLVAWEFVYAREHLIGRYGNGSLDVTGFVRRLVTCIDNQHLAPRIRARVHMTTAMMDTICPPSTQFAAYNKIDSEKDMTIYPDFGHEDLPGLADRLLGYFSEL